MSRAPARNSDIQWNVMQVSDAKLFQWARWMGRTEGGAALGEPFFSALGEWEHSVSTQATPAHGASVAPSGAV